MVSGNTPGHGERGTGTTQGSEQLDADRTRSSDVVLALVVFALEIGGLISRKVNELGDFSLSLLAGVGPTTYVLLAISSIALLWRRSRPFVVLGVTLAASLIWDILQLTDGPSLAIIVAIYGVGRYIDQDKMSLLGLGAAVAIVAFDDLIIENEGASVVGLSLALAFVPWYVGRRIRSRREYLALLEERAQFLENERLAEADRAVEEERTRIARELHDLVAHRVSMITVQAGAAQTVATTDPQRAIRAMEAVETEGREALRELRQVLGVLRQTDDSNGLGPVHGLAEIPALVEEMGDAGIEVLLFSEGPLEDIPSGVDLAAYRIVQEALTNTLKHAGPDAGVEVRLTTDQGTLTIDVSDRGVGSTTLPGSGQGLIGMRERTALLGGSFEAGPRLGGGFRVVARLPIEGSAS